MAVLYHGSLTHDHCLEVEAAIVVRVCSDCFERLLSRSRNVVHELVGEVPIQSVLRPGSVVRYQLYCGELYMEERCMIAATPVLSITQHRIEVTLTLQKTPSSLR